MERNTSKQAVIKNRRQMVARLRLRGLTQRDVLDALNQQLVRDSLAEGISPDEIEQWSLGTINGDIKAIEREWMEQAMRDVGEHKARVLAELDEVLREAWKVGDIKHVLAVMSQTRALMGLDKPTVSHIQSLDIDVSNLSDAQLQRIADGEDPLAVLATSGTGGTGEAQTDGD